MHRGAPGAARNGAFMNASNDRPLGNVRELAVQIADRFARSEIEMFCRNVSASKGRPVFDLSCPLTDSCAPACALLVAIAESVRYIELRSDALPYRMHHIDDLVWFEERE
jgi:hypothetical protein